MAKNLFKLDPLDTVAVIGGGAGIMNEKGIGKRIDSYDAVVRVNWYHIKGYEDTVGTRVDYWMTALRPWNHAPPENFGQIKQVWIYPFYEFSPETHRGHMNICPDKQIVSDRAFYMWTYSLIPGNKWPTTGFGALLYVLTKLRPSRILLAGFDKLLDPASAYTYYYGGVGVGFGKDGQGRGRSNHSFNDEYRVFKEFTLGGYKEEWRRNGCQLLISQ